MKNVAAPLFIVWIRRCGIGVFVLLISACGPTQGYPGPERPDSETALVEPTGDEDISIRVGEYDFKYRGIRLLPGKYTFSVDYSYKDTPYDCRQSEEFNHYGYQSCRDEQSKEIRKNSRYVRDCDPDDYYDRYEECLVPYFDSMCSLSAKVEAGKSYEMTFGIRGVSGAPELREAVAHRIVEVGKCQKPTNRTESERRSL